MTIALKTTIDSLCLPVPYSHMKIEDLQSTVQKIYTFCLENPTKPSGSLFLSMEMDLSKKKVYLHEKLLHKVKIVVYLSNNTTSALEWRFTFDDKQEQYTTLPCTLTISRKYFDGLEYEKTYHHAFLPIIPTWDDWEKIVHLQSNQYENVIHPRIVTTLSQICSIVGKKIEVIDLGGGSGKLAVELLNKLKSQIQKILLFDKTDKLIKFAQHKAKTFKPQLIAISKDILDNAFPYDKQKESFDVVILSGVVAHQVMTKEEAFLTMKKCHQLLRQNGFAIVTSFTPSHLCAHEFTQLGYKVLNKSDGYFIGQQWESLDYYILQKT